MNDQKGQALPLVLLVLAIGILLIAPFLGHAGSSLIGSRIYGQAITEQYSADAGIDHAIWRLTYDGLAAQLPFPGDSSTDDLSEGVNGLTPTIIVTKIGTIYAFGGEKKKFWRYDIAGNTWTSRADAPGDVKEGGSLASEIGYEIVSTAGDITIRAFVKIEGETVSILSWEVE